MSMPPETKQISASFDRPAADVYRYASDPANIPAWAPGLGSSVENIDGHWFVETPAGRAGFAFVEPNEFGVLDHEVTLPQGWQRPAINAYVTLRPRGGLRLRVRPV